MKPASYMHAAEVTPSDSADLPSVSAAALVAAVAGVANVVTVSDENVTVGLAAGVPLPLAVKRVKSTSTTATGIVALW